MSSFSLCRKCLWLTHRSIHHVRFAIPQGLYSVENINHTLSLCHLAHDTAGTEHSTTPTSISTNKHNRIHDDMSQKAQFNISFGFFQLLCRADAFNFNGKRRETLWFVCTHRQCTMVLPSPSSPSRCHWSTWRISLRKERLDAGTSLCPDHPRYWKWRTIK